MKVNDAEFDQNSFLQQSANFHQTLEEHQAGTVCYVEFSSDAVHQIIQCSAFFPLISE